MKSVLVETLKTIQKHFGSTPNSKQNQTELYPAYMLIPKIQLAI